MFKMFQNKIWEGNVLFLSYQLAGISVSQNEATPYRLLTKNDSIFSSYLLSEINIQLGQGGWMSEF